MSGRQIKIGKGFKFDKAGKLVAKPAYATVSEKLKRAESKKQRVVRRTPT